MKFNWNLQISIDWDVKTEVSKIDITLLRATRKWVFCHHTKLRKDGKFEVKVSTWWCARMNTLYPNESY